MIEFRNVHFFQDTRRIDFNIVLHENGEILTQYRNIADDGRERGNSATLGIEYHTGAAALRFSFNQTLLSLEPAVTSIRYLPAPTHAVSGQVRDADDQPVANATVTIEGTPLTATTATDGASPRACPRAPTPSRRRDQASATLASFRSLADDRLHAPRRSDAFGHT